MKNLIVSVPRLEAHRPPISVAIVAHAIELAGYPVTAVDLNIKFFRYINSVSKYYQLDDVWDGLRNLSYNEFKIVIQFLRKYNSVFANHDRLLISVFGSSATTFTHILCKFAKKYHSHLEIVLGGQGVITTNIGNSGTNFGDKMLSLGLADSYISGEGEVAVLEYLKNNFNYPGINSPHFQQIDELNELPFPNYKYFDLEEYDYPDGKTKEVFVVGSRGCVRRCTYCDVARYWPKYRYRSGKNIADELIFHYEQSGINRFYFTDSLINGSLKSFRDMCEHLAHYNTTHQAGFSWSSQFIFRPKKHVPPQDFEVMKQAGADIMYVGVETGSDKVRWEMDKKFTNEDVDYQLEQFSRNGLKVMFLMLMGYITETQKDHQDTLDMFRRWQKYVADGTIVGCDLGVSLTFLKDTPVEKMTDSHEVFFYANQDTNQYYDYTKLWESALNPELTIHERIRRRLETHREAIRYNWPIWRGPQRLQNVKLVAEEYLKFLRNAQHNSTSVVQENGLNFIQVVNI